MPVDKPITYNTRTQPGISGSVNTLRPKEEDNGSPWPHKMDVGNVAVGQVTVREMFARLMFRYHLGGGC